MARILLDVPYFSQIDSETDQGQRMCFSSTCAMVLNYLIPNSSLFNKPGQKDDIYLRALNNAGFDSTNPDGHIMMLNRYGIVCEFSQKLNWSYVNDQLVKGRPVPVGILHKGPASNPTGGGHWVLIVGHNEDKTVYYVNDPYGELNLATGVYGKVNGKMVKYNKAAFSKRWTVEGPNTGWGIKILDVKK